MSATGVPLGFTVCPTPDGRFADAVGPLYIRRDKQSVQYGFRVEERHSNIRGALHGGMTLTLADQVLGLTVFEAVGGQPIATISLNADFVAPAFPGDWLEGQAEIIRTTRSLVFVRGLLSRGADVVLTATGVWKVFRTPRGESAAPQARDREP
jgi:uncharacterized protein (TIGR00369 family)